MGGILARARGMTAVCAPTVNAYKRFVAQELGPYFVDWGTDNRSVCVRIPAERGKAARLESRLSDGSASAYLSSAAHIFAGVDGVERQLEPGPPTALVYEPPVERETVPFSLARRSTRSRRTSSSARRSGSSSCRRSRRSSATSGLPRVAPLPACRHGLGATRVRRRPLVLTVRRARVPSGRARARRRDREPRLGRLRRGRSGEPARGARLARRPAACPYAWS